MGKFPLIGRAWHAKENSTMFDYSTLVVSDLYAYTIYLADTNIPQSDGSGKSSYMNEYAW
jgi:hypothetical protein